MASRSDELTLRRVRDAADFIRGLLRHGNGRMTSAGRHCAQARVADLERVASDLEASKDRRSERAAS